MSSKKVDLSVWVDGKRKVIGEAVVDLAEDGRYLDVSAVVTDQAWALKLSDGSGMSLGFSPERQPDGGIQYRPSEFDVVQPLKIKGKIPSEDA